MSRLHIGHPYVTHAFSLTREEPPLCIARGERLAVEHILPFCFDLTENKMSLNVRDVLQVSQCRFYCGPHLFCTNPSLFTHTT